MNIATTTFASNENFEEEENDVDDAMLDELDEELEEELDEEDALGVATELPLAKEEVKDIEEDELEEPASILEDDVEDMDYDSFDDEDEL